MAFPYAIITGIGRAASADRERQDKLDYEDRQQRAQTRQNFLAHLDKIASDENWPDAARSAAAHGYLQASMDPKFDEKRASRIWDNVWRSSVRPTPTTTSERTTATINDNAPGIAAGLDALAPGAGSMFTGSAHLSADRIPTGNDRPQLSGLLTTPELEDRSAAADDRKFQSAVRLYSAQQEIQNQYRPLASPVEVSPGASLMTPTGHLIGTAPVTPGSVKPSEADKDREEAYALYSALHKIPVERVKADPVSRVAAEREYADRSGRTPQPARLSVQGILLDPNADPNQKATAQTLWNTMHSGTTTGTGTAPGTVDPSLIAGDVEDVLTGRNTLYNIRQTMGRSKGAQAYMEEMRRRIRAVDPRFDFVASDAGSKFVSSPFYQRAITAITAVEPNIAKAVALSKQISRVGVRGVDAMLQRGAIQFGNKKVANFHEMRNLIADEIGLALGQGSVTDMKLQLGFDITDPAVTDEVFASNMGIVQDFIRQRKEALKAQRYFSPSRPDAPGNVHGAGPQPATGGKPGDPLGILP